MAKALRIGVIGTGLRSELADRYLAPGDGVALAAGADPRASARERFRDRVEKRLGRAPALYSDFREMLRKEALDGVFVTSPDDCHEEHATAALEAGLGVYLEKPMAIGIEGADRILRTARERGARLVVGHNMRYMPFARKMKSLIAAGAIGEVKAVWCRHFIGYGGDAYFRDWHADRRRTNGLLLQKGAHDLDVIHWLAGAYTARVQGLGGLTVYGGLPRRGPGEPDPEEAPWSPAHWPPAEQSGFAPVLDVEDLSMLQMRLSNGVFAAYLQCHFTPDACRNYTVIGTRGRLENYGDHHDDTTIELWDERRTDAFRLRGDATFRTPAAAGGHGGADPEIVRSFFDTLRGAGRPAATPQDARYSVAAGCMGTESLRRGGQPMDIPPLPPGLEAHDFAR